MKDGVITNDNRIVAALPTIKKLVADGGKVILCSHLGKPEERPRGQVQPGPRAPCACPNCWGKPVVFADDDTVVGENAKAAVAAMNDGDVVLLQNTRFRKEETKNLEPEFCQRAGQPGRRCMSTTPSAPPTAHTAPPPASPTTSRTPLWAT